VRFLEHPVKAFLRERLGFYANDRHQLEVALRVELTPLERWGVGERLLQARLSGQGWDHALAAERGRGLLPPGPMRDTTLDELVAVVSGLVSRVEALPEAATRPVAIDVNVALPDGRAVVGTVPGVRQGALMRCTFSRLGPKHRLRAWAQFLAVSAAHPDLVPTAVTIGQADNSTAARPRVSVSTLGPLAGDAGEVHRLAQQALGVLVDLYDKGMAEPLPLYCATSAAWAASTRAAEDSVREARARWAPGFDEIPGESAEPEHQLVLGGIVPFDQLLAVPPAPGESGPGWAAAEHTRLGRLAERLWAPVLRLEKVGRS
jgi:exodeoxyribonuclease V gamma subunit